jgi:hypothetical protein
MSRTLAYNNFQPEDNQVSNNSESKRHPMDASDERFDRTE